MLKLQNLTKTYANGVRALDGVSLDIPRGMPTGSAVILSGAAEWERWAEGTATEAVFVH